MNKTISVIMGIYNCADTLPMAIKSILNQSYTNWKLIMCDDGSSDNTYEVAITYADRYPEKMILLQNKSNKGLNYTLNRCLEYADTDYVARMDGDDICSPERFQIEVETLNAHPELSFVSTDMGFFDENGVFGQISHPTHPTNKDFMKENPFCHAPCMVRKSAYDDVNGYSEDKRLLRVEDYHLWVKMYAVGHKGMNIHQVLYWMRDDRNAYKRRSLNSRVNAVHVHHIAIKELDLPFWMNIYCLRPILTWLIPAWLYNYLHKKRLNNQMDQKIEELPEV